MKESSSLRWIAFVRPAVGLLLFYKEKSEENENMKTYKIAVAGTGYVGLSLSVLLAQHNQVMAVDIVQAKVDMINNHKSKMSLCMMEGASWYGSNMSRAYRIL